MALLLSRSEGQKVFIKDQLTGEVIEVFVNELRSIDVSLGFDCSQRFVIVREEVEIERKAHEPNTSFSS